MKYKMPRSVIMLVLLITSISISSSALNEPKPLLRHVVSFQFKDEISDERKAQAVDDFLDLKNRIPQIIKFEGGEDVSVEGHAKGFTHCYVLTFENEQDRNTYLSHKAHVEVAEKNKPLMKDLFVFDYWGEE